MKKISKDIILHTSTINENHDDDSWDMELHRQNIFSFWTIFCLFAPLPLSKELTEPKLWKNGKNTWRYHHFKCTRNDNHTIHGYWDRNWDREWFLSFWTIFCPFTPLTQKIEIWKKTGDIIILQKWNQKSWSCTILFLSDMWWI